MRVYFSPNGGAEAALIHEIEQAHKQILVQAYRFTSVPIENALVEAKERGVDVRVLFDKTDETRRGSIMSKMKKAGILVGIDDAVNIAHNKVSIIDSTIVVTGSFNYSDNAEHHNAENLIVIHNHTIAMDYLENWEIRDSLSEHPRAR